MRELCQQNVQPIKRIAKKDWLFVYKRSFVKGLSR